MTGDDMVTIKLAEYAHAQDMLKHYDALNWQIGSILIGANAVLLGLVVNVLPRTGWVGMLIAAAVSGFSALLLGSWLTWFTRHRDLYNFRNETLHRIEIQLGMFHFLPVAEASLPHPLDGEETEQLRRAREVAYAMPGTAEFRPLYPGLRLGGTSGYNTARRLCLFVPLAEFATLASVVIALNT